MRFLWFFMIATIAILLLIFFYAYIYYPTQEVPVLIEEVDEGLPKHEDGNERRLLMPVE